MLKLKAAEEKVNVINVKLYRFRRQKRIWYKKIIKTVTRSIDNLEDLKRAKQ